MVLYEVLTGERAFRGESAVDTLHAIIHEEPAGLEALSRRVPAGGEQVLRRCLEKDPERRYPNGGELAAALEEVAQPSSSSAASAAPVQRVGPQGRSARRWIWPAAAVVLAAGALWLSFSSSDPENATRPSTEASLPPMRTVPFTTFSGREE